MFFGSTITGKTLPSVKEKPQDHCAMGSYSLLENDYDFLKSPVLLPTDNRIGGSRPTGHNAKLIGVPETGHDHSSCLTTSSTYLSNYGYPTTIYTNTSALTKYGVISLLSNSGTKVFASRSHGGYTANSTYIELPSTNLYSTDLSGYDLSNLYVALFIGCWTGYGGVGGNNLPSAAVAQGADCSVGFSQSIGCAKANEWTVQCFYDLCVAEYTVYQTCTYLGSLTKYTQAGLGSYVICGASGTYL